MFEGDPPQLCEQAPEDGIAKRVPLPLSGASRIAIHPAAEYASLFRPTILLSRLQTARGTFRRWPRRCGGSCGCRGGRRRGVPARWPCRRHRGRPVRTGRADQSRARRISRKRAARFLERRVLQRGDVGDPGGGDPLRGPAGVAQRFDQRRHAADERLFGKGRADCAEVAGRLAGKRFGEAGIGGDAGVDLRRGEMIEEADADILRPRRRLSAVSCPRRSSRRSSPSTRRSAGRSRHRRGRPRPRRG